MCRSTIPSGCSRWGASTKTHRASFSSPPMVPIPAISPSLGIQPRVKSLRPCCVKSLRSVYTGSYPQPIVTAAVTLQSYAIRYCLILPTSHILNFFTTKQFWARNVAFEILTCDMEWLVQGVCRTFVRIGRNPRMSLRYCLQPNTVLRSGIWP